MSAKNKSVSSVIADINDQIRSMIPFVPKPHMLVLTEGVLALPEGELASLCSQVRKFSNFTSDNNPYGENDFGSVLINEEKFFWKFDYFDDGFQFYKENGHRVLTIMRADEY